MLRPKKQTAAKKKAVPKTKARNYEKEIAASDPILKMFREIRKGEISGKITRFESIALYTNLMIFNLIGDVVMELRLLRQSSARKERR